jgi:hypothetical protein
MSSFSSISSDKLSQLIGTANASTLIDVRSDEDFAADLLLIPGATRRSHRNIQDWAPGLAGQSVRRGSATTASPPQCAISSCATSTISFPR